MRELTRGGYPGRVQPLRLAWLWIAVGFCWVAAVAGLALAPAADLPRTSFGDHVEHAVAFLGLTLWFSGIALRPRYWVVASALFLFGAGIEWAQGATSWGRVSDLSDVGANSAGILFGLAGARAGLGGWMGWVEARVLPGGSYSSESD